MLGRIGSGGMGLTFLAEDPWGRRVVVKIVRDEWADDPSFVARFAREAESLASVHDPRIVRVLHRDLTADPPFLVTEYVPGPTLRQRVAAEGPLRPDDVRVLARELAAAVAAMHHVGLTHRDLTPANVILSPEGPRVIDFGLAKAAESSDAPSTLMGTPGWVAPEGLQGRPVGTAADVFLWGSLVAFAATGRPPFGEEPFDASAKRVLAGSPDLRGLPAELGDLMDIVRLTLSTDPLHRPSAWHIASWLSPDASPAAGTRPAGARPPTGTPTGPPTGPVTDVVVRTPDPVTDVVRPVTPAGLDPGRGEDPVARQSLWRRSTELRLLAYGGVLGIVVSILYDVTLGPLLDFGNDHGEGAAYWSLAGLQEILPLSAACGLLAAATLARRARTWHLVGRLLPTLGVLSVASALLWHYAGSQVFEVYPRNAGLMLPAAFTASMALALVLDSRGTGLVAFGAMAGLAAPAAGFLTSSWQLPYAVYMVLYCLGAAASLAAVRAFVMRRMRSRGAAPPPPPGRPVASAHR